MAWRDLRQWGSTADERTVGLPGDDLVVGDVDQVTRGIWIGAPADAVWRWLVQIGQDRGGWYSFDRLEDLIGLDIHSTDEIRPEWQHLDVGDRIVQVRPGWGPLPDGYSMPVAVVEQGRALVLRQAPPEHPWDATWAFVIRPTGPTSCRLLARSRSLRPDGRSARVAAAVGDHVMGPITLVMERGMLRGIKARAERDPASGWEAERGDLPTARDGGETVPRPEPVAVP